MNRDKLLDAVSQDSLTDIFTTLYGNNEETLSMQKERYLQAVKSFAAIYPESEDISIFSAPGRTEVCGNHTDHQHGCVLAAAVDLDAIAIVSFHHDHVIRIQSVGYEQESIELDDLSIRPEEIGTSRALVRGIVSRFHDMGIRVDGFNAYITSDVLSGSGLSSSAAFEVLIGNIIDWHYNGGQVGAVEIARIGQYAENQYFGKESGLMDQMVSSVGGFVFIDFEDAACPSIEKHECRFEEGGLKLIITDTRGSHADLTDDYVSIPTEMKLVAEQFGKTFLRDVGEEQFYQSLPHLRTVCPDRAILRAAHFFSDNARVKKEVEALDDNDFPAFLHLVRESGRSSAELLQNLYSTKKPIEQGIPLALMVSGRLLGDRGAFRVHGGGFAGTIQAFVPTELIWQYETTMEALFGEGCCYILNIRPAGGLQVI